MYLRPINFKREHVSVPMLKANREQYVEDLFEHIGRMCWKRTNNTLRFVKYYWIQYYEDKYRTFVVETDNPAIRIRKITITPDDRCESFQVVAYCEHYQYIINIGFDRLDVIKYFITSMWINAARYDYKIWDTMYSFERKMYNKFIEWFV